MFGEMRRQDRKLNNGEAADLLKRCQYGVLSTAGPDGYAYGTPLSYVYLNNAVYFHSAVEGHKLDNIKYNDRVSFCVVGEVESVPEKFTTKYESVIVFGKASEVFDDEKNTAFLAIIDKYSSRYAEKGKEYIKKADDKVKIIKIQIEHITGKANR